jgi:hypothetical protein
MRHFNQVIKNVLPDYGISGFDKNFMQSALGYILSAIVGIAAIVIIFWLVAKLIPENKAKAS